VAGLVKQREVLCEHFFRDPELEMEESSPS